MEPKLGKFVQCKTLGKNWSTQGVYTFFLLKQKGESISQINYPEFELIIALHEKCPNKNFFSGPYFPVFSRNTGKYGPEKNAVFGYSSRSVDLSSAPLFNFNFKSQQKESSSILENKYS